MKKLLALKIVLTLFSAVLLTACGTSVLTGATGSTEVNTRTTNYETGEFSIQTPENWKIVDPTGGSYTDEMVIAFKNNVVTSDFTANINIVKEENPDTLTSYDAAQKKLAAHNNSLLNYTLIAQEEILMGTGGGDSRTFLNKFSGQNTVSGPVLNFMQVTVAKAGNIWTATAAYKEGEDPFVVDKLETSLKSFYVK